MAVILTVLLPILAFLAVTGLVLGVQYALATRRHAFERLAVYGARATAATTAAAVDDLLKDRRYSRLAFLDEQLRKSSYAERVARDLAAAAIPLRVGEYVLLRWLIGAGLASVMLLGRMPVPLALAIGLIGFFLPVVYVRRRQAKRVQKFTDQLIDGLTLMANALRSGNSFLQALDLVAREMPEPLGAEFGQVVAEISVGAPVEESLTALTRRVPSYDLYLVVTSMLVQREIGGNLAEVLDGIAHTIRERIRILRDVQVLTAEQRFSAYIIGAMPFFLLATLGILSPTYIEPLFTTSTGHILLAIGGLFEGIGFWTMRRLASIEV